MGEKTGISWTDSTINVWHGCDKVSAGCKHCYAEVSTPVRVKRAKGLELWGRDADRSETRDWDGQIRRMAHDVIYSASGGPHRVFGQSLSDTFEDRRDLDPLRARFFAALTRWTSRSLTFQLLTKRPENVLRMVPPSWLDNWPAHVWIGATAENQETLDARAVALCSIPAHVLFLSIEPQLGPVNTMPLIGAGAGHRADFMAKYGSVRLNRVRWVIQGGESGSKARPFMLDWMFDMRAQCAAAGVAWFPKQAGARPMYGEVPVEMADSHGGDESEWPILLRGCRAFPS